MENLEKKIMTVAYLTDLKGQLPRLSYLIKSLERVSTEPYTTRGSERFRLIILLVFIFYRHSYFFLFIYVRLRRQLVGSTEK